VIPIKLFDKPASHCLNVSNPNHQNANHPKVVKRFGILAFGISVIVWLLVFGFWCFIARQGGLSDT
jgi:hypothetical protein